jgi:hypothetical protein
MNHFRLQYMCTWKCCNETPYIAILYKQKCLFFQKQENRKVKQFLSLGWCQWVGERVCEGEYGGNITYSCMKMEK